MKQRNTEFRMPILEGGKFKEWFYWGFIGDTENEFISPHSGYRKCPSFEFTGLKDKNGQKIYEGDILQCKTYYVGIKWWSTVSEIPGIKKRTDDGRENYHTEKYAVSFKDGAFCYGYRPLSEFQIREGVIVEKVITGQTHSNDFEQKWWDFEVIGNVYQNPELLENC